MQSGWSDQDAPRDLLDLRVYTSRLIGTEESLVLWGGGNTSVKLVERDYRDDSLDVLRVKGSGSDLKTIGRQDFAGVRQADVLRLRSVESMTDEAMVSYLTHALVHPTDPRPSIETLLHGFLPQRFVDHTHADAVVAITNQADGEAEVRRVYGNQVAVVPWVRPGFDLSRAVAAAWERAPDVDGVVLINHGLFTFDDDARASYERTIRLVSEAEQFAEEARHGRRLFAGATPSPDPERVAVAATAIRGAIPFSTVLDYEGSSEALAFVNDAGAARIARRGPATPDHALRTKGWPAAVTVSPDADAETLSGAVRDGIATFVGEYETYVQRYATAETPTLDPYPRVVLVPGVGMFGVGTNARNATIARDIYRQTLSVIRDATAIGAYRPVAEPALFDMEYWPLELYKLTLAPPPKPLAGQIALVTGAASGIGRSIAQRLAQDGAVVAVTDLDGAGAEAVAAEIRADTGQDRAALGLTMDVTDETSVVTATTTVATAYGGLDILVSNAGMAVVSRLDDLSLAEWQRSMSVNATGHFLAARAAVRLMRRQDRGGCVIFISSKNAFAPGREFGAYAAGKAAETQVAKVLATENGSAGIRVNMINPDAIFRGSKLWSEKVRSNRAAAHGVTPEGLEAFYAQHNLLGAPIYPEDVADAAAFLASGQAAKITGCTITVDGGVAEAFPR